MCLSHSVTRAVLEAMTKIVDFGGYISQDVRSMKSYKGRPMRPEQRYELDHKDVRAMLPRMKGIPLCYNHNDHIVVGSVTDSEMPDSRRWKVKGRVEARDTRSTMVADMIEAGLLHSLSLKHHAGTLEPLEVSFCFKGAREGTEITDLMVYDSNQDLYKHPSSDNDDIVACSSSADADDILILPFDEDDMVVAASQAPPATAPAAADAPPAAPPADLTQQAQPMEVEPTAADSEELKTMFPKTHEVRDAMGGDKASGIPSKLTRMQIVKTVTELEAEKRRLEEENRAKDELIKQHESEKERIRKEAAELALRERAAQEKHDQAKQFILDYSNTHRIPNADKHLQAVSSLSPDQSEAVATLVAAAYTPQHIVDKATAAGAAADDHAEIAMAEYRIMNEYRQRVLQQQQQQQRPDVVAAAATTTTPPASFRHPWSTPPSVPQRHFQPPKRVDLGPFQVQPNGFLPGKPIANRIALDDPMVVAASNTYHGSMTTAQQCDRDHVGKEGEAYESGAGPNFPHSFMTRPGQLAAFIDTPSDGRYFGKHMDKEVSYNSPLFYSEDFRKRMREGNIPSMYRNKMKSYEDALDQSTNYGDNARRLMTRGLRP
jgi:hypothetical protein